MIPFFRKIRKKMADDNRPIKYARYAIGEIVLVVIGILIALQINNWNEDRKLNNIGRAILKEIKLNLIESEQKLTMGIQIQEKQILHYESILEYINNDLPYSPVLDSAFSQINRWYAPYLTYTSYETLKVQGLNIIANDSIRRGITEMYETNFTYLIKDYDQAEWLRAESITFPFFEKNVRRSLTDDFLARPNDFETLKKNDEFINILHSNIGMRRIGVSSFTEVIQEIKALILMIDRELKLKE
jgi:hypothetical protein